MCRYINCPINYFYRVLDYAMSNNIIGRVGNLNNNARVYCIVCGKEKKITEVVNVSNVRKSIADNINLSPLSTCLRK